MPCNSWSQALSLTSAVAFQVITYLIIGQGALVGLPIIAFKRKPQGGFQARLPADGVRSLPVGADRPVRDLGRQSDEAGLLIDLRNWVAIPKVSL